MALDLGTPGLQKGQGGGRGRWVRGVRAGRGDRGALGSGQCSEPAFCERGPSPPTVTNCTRFPCASHRRKEATIPGPAPELAPKQSSQSATRTHSGLLTNNSVRSESHTPPSIVWAFDSHLTVPLMSAFGDFNKRRVIGEPGVPLKREKKGGYPGRCRKPTTTSSSSCSSVIAASAKPACFSVSHPPSSPFPHPSSIQSTPLLFALAPTQHALISVRRIC